MTSRLIIAALAIAVTAGAVAQGHEARMKQIRDAYANRVNIMKDKPTDDALTPFNEVTTSATENLPGSGLCRHEKHFYFTQPDFAESDDGEFDSTLHSTLYYATSHDVYAGTHHYIWEFLWHPEAGDPMFAMLIVKEGDGNGSSQKTYRFYLDKGKVFKAVPDISSWGDPEEDLLVPPFTSLEAVPAKMAKQCAALDTLLEDVVISNK